MWVPWFYMPDSDSDYYDTLYFMVNGDKSSYPRRVGLRQWLVEIETIRRKLPRCEYGTGGWFYWDDGYGNSGYSFTCFALPEPCYGCILASVDPVTGQPNPPCQWHPLNPNFSSVDQDIDDEFFMARHAINNFIDAVDRFRQACKALYEGLAALDPIDPDDTPMDCGLAGGNPAWYNWTDSRGDHSIWVEIGAYQEPYIAEKRHGNWLKGKICLELYNYTQNISVNILRTSPVVDVGILGKWNEDSQTISRRSVAQYRGLKSFDDRCYPAGWVRIVGR